MEPHIGETLITVHHSGREHDSHMMASGEDCLSDTRYGG